MTKNDLEKLRGLHAEYNAAKHAVRKMAGTDMAIASDIVYGSRDEIPYDYHAITVTGNGSHKFSKLVRDRNYKRVLLRLEIERIYEWVETLDDPEIRAIIETHYIHYESWRKTAEIVYPGEERGESYPRDKIKAFFKAVSGGAISPGAPALE